MSVTTLSTYFRKATHLSTDTFGTCTTYLGTMRSLRRGGLRLRGRGERERFRCTRSSRSLRRSLSLSLERSSLFSRTGGSLLLAGGKLWSTLLNLPVDGGPYGTPVKKTIKMLHSSKLLTVHRWWLGETATIKR